MPTRLEQKILHILPNDGSTRGNISLINELNCTSEEYTEAKENLLRDGSIILGKGRGGAIRLSGEKRIDLISHKMLAYIKRHHSDGTSVGNKTLRTELKLSEDEYWEARNILIDNGDITVGGGRGGSVYLVDNTTSIISYPRVDKSCFKKPAEEKNLMLPLCETLNRHWAKQKIYGENFEIIDTSKQGKNCTGKWSRPDFFACTCREYKYTNKYIELTSFEVKAHNGVDEAIVYEALSHKKSMHYSFLLIHNPEQENTIKEKTWDSIYKEARRHGIGIICFSDPYDFDSWDFWLEAIRNEPTPENIEDFFNQQAFSSDVKKRIQNWLVM